LVNLKRPTLLLQQLVQDVAASSSMVHEQEGEITPANASMLSLVPVHPLHLLKFNYDATTPLVNISLSIHPTPTQDAEGKASAAEEDIKVMYSGVHEGGFNQVFTLPAEAALDLSDAVTPLAAPAVDQQVTAQSSVDKIDPNVSSVARESYSEDTNRSSLERTMGNPQVAAATEPDLETVPELGGPNATTSTLGETPADRRAPRRFGIFPRRQREPDVEEAARIEMSNRPAEGEGAKSEEVKAPEKGMRLLIRIEAVGDGGESKQSYRL